MSLAVQDALVTVMALVSALIVLRRVFGVFAPSARPHCSNCASGAAACARPADDRDAAPVQVVLHRRRS